MNEMQPLISLPSDEAHLWIVSLEKVNKPETLLACENLLSAGERAQWQKFHVEKRRRQYLVTRALVRLTLSRYIDRPPESWQFVTDKYGRPEIAPEEPPLKLRFNVSHTNHFAACAVTFENDIGVDIEETGRKLNWQEIAKKYFSSQESDDLFQRPESEQKLRFFDYWTLKEALTKADGRGLLMRLNHFTFHFSEDRQIKVTFSPLEKMSGHWQFWQMKPTEECTVAVALRKADRTACRLLMKESSFLTG